MTLPPRLEALCHETIAWFKRSKVVEYADLRWERRLQESLIVQNGAVQHISTSVSEGCALRALAHGAWGYASSSDLAGRGLRATAERAVTMAKASALANRDRVPFPTQPPQRGSYRTPIEIDPFTVELQKKLDYLLWANRILREHPNIKTATTAFEFYRAEKYFVSTEGALIQQDIVESGATMEALAVLDGDVQRRSYPTANGVCVAQAGYEYVKGLDLVGHAPRVRREAIALLRAKECPAETTTVILMPDQLALQLHESCGHPIELDRVLGQELSFAGGSFLDPEKLGRFRYGSKHVNITADATCARGVGTFGYDDEGVPAQTVPIVRDGVFINYLSSRESAARLKLASSGAMRADGWNAMPLVRMTNVNLEPGPGTLSELVAGTRRGVLFATNKSWSIDDQRLNFQFGTEIGWEIRHGTRGAVVKNPVYTGITPKFWGSCSGVAGQPEWVLYGVPNCAKGEPMQIMHTGHGAAPARFERVQIGRARSRR